MNITFAKKVSISISHIRTLREKMGEGLRDQQRPFLPGAPGLGPFKPQSYSKYSTFKVSLFSVMKGLMSSGTYGSRASRTEGARPSLVKSPANHWKICVRQRRHRLIVRIISYVATFQTSLSPRGRPPLWLDGGLVLLLLS